MGHFNVSNLEQLKAVVDGAKKVKAPVMIGTSEGERNWLGLKQIVVLINSWREEYPFIFLNADHTKSIRAAFDAVEAGYYSIHFDGSKLGFEDNVTQTKEVVDKTKVWDPEISVEGELGYIAGESEKSSKVIEIKPEDYTDPDKASQFVLSTGVDRLAVAVGNIHGINLNEPKLDFERIGTIKKAVGEKVSLVLHAGSGIPDEDIKKAIFSGMANVHISTELRVAFREGLEKALKDKPDEYSPYKLYAQDVAEMEEIVIKKLELFGSAGRVDSLLDGQ